MHVDITGCTDINVIILFTTVDDGAVYPYLDTVQYTDCQFDVDISMGTQSPYFFETQQWDVGFG